MDMVTIDQNKKTRNGRKVFLLGLSAFIFGVNSEVFAFNWTIRPSLTVSEVFSDNIDQDSSGKRSALVTEVSPGVSIQGGSTVNSFDLNYRMQTVYNAGGNSGLDINNQLQMNSQYQFLRNSLFMDTTSSISQQNVSNRSIASDNLTGNSDSTTVSTFSISPYWTPHFKGFADGEVRVTYNTVSTHGGQSELSDSNSFSQNVQLNSGRDFSRFTWFATYNNSTQSNGGGDDVTFQNSTAGLRAFLNRKLNGFIRVGNAWNQFQSTTDSNRNGFFYTAGAQWIPSARLSVEVGYGNNAFVTVNISPIINRLNWIITYSNNDIGTNTGDRWQSSLNYNTRRSVWSFTYSEDTTTTQQQLLENQVFFVQDAFGNPINDPVTEQPFLFSTDLPTLTDEVFINKSGNLSVSFQTGKSDFNISGNYTRREFEVSQNQEDVYGFSGSWSWDFTQRSSSNIRLSWQTTDGQDGGSDERFQATVSVTRNIVRYMSKQLSGQVEYRYTNQQSDLSINEFSENRISASLSMQF